MKVYSTVFDSSEEEEKEFRTRVLVVTEEYARKLVRQLHRKKLDDIAVMQSLIESELDEKGEWPLKARRRIFIYDNYGSIAKYRTIVYVPEIFQKRFFNEVFKLVIVRCHNDELWVQVFGAEEIAQWPSFDVKDLHQLIYDIATY